MSHPLVPATVSNLEGYHGLVHSRLVPGCCGPVLRVRADENTVDVAWLGKSDGTGDEIEHRVPIETLLVKAEI